VNTRAHERYLRDCLERLPPSKRKAIEGDPELARLPRRERLIEAGTRCGRALSRRQVAKQRRRLGFTEARKREATRIAARDPGLADLLDGRGYRVDRVIAWTPPGRFELAGGVVEMTLSRPLKGVRARLPDRCLARDRAGEVDVERHVLILRAERLAAFAELRTRRVAVIRVLPPGRAVPLPGDQIGRCRPTRD
jgi:hypothetical protein